MKKLLLLCALAVSLFAGQTAHAKTYSLSFAGCFGLVFFGACTATPVANGTSGSDTEITFRTVGSLSPGFPIANTSQIDSISGTVDIGGDIYTIGNLATGLGGDNLLIDGFFTGLNFDGNGVDFLLSGSGTPDYTELNITFGSVQGKYTFTVDQCHKGVCTPQTKTGTDFGLAITDIDKADPPAATPEPGSLALLGKSIVGGAGVLRRRFRA
jgi:hypothetical protein